MRVYRGIRSTNDRTMKRVTVTVDNGKPETLHHVAFHSPTGFEWGYGGSGPADLALSILTDYFKAQDDPNAEDRAFAVHQAFKYAFVSRFPDYAWEITSDEIAAWLVKEAKERD